MRSWLTHLWHQFRTENYLAWKKKSLNGKLNQKKKKKKEKEKKKGKENSV